MGNLHEITSLMDDLNIDVMGVQETKRPMNDIIKKNGYIFVFSSSVEGKSKGVGDRSFQHRANKGRRKKTLSIEDAKG